MTAGSEGCAIATEKHLVQVPVVPLDEVVDATGAGDAFLGGLIASLYHKGFPQAEQQLYDLGHVANTVGSICCQVLGAVPDQFARKELKEQLKDFPVMEERLRPSSGFDESLENDAVAASQIVGSLDKRSVTAFIDILFRCKGNVIVSGLGKSGIVAQRMASSLASTGTPSHFVVASEWPHGDYGKARPNTDVVILLSHSGTTSECCRAARYLRSLDVQVLSIVGTAESGLALDSDASIAYDVTVEEPLGGVPSASIVVQEMIANAIIRELIERRKFGSRDFARFHPGGSLGERLGRV